MQITCIWVFALNAFHRHLFLLACQVVVIVVPVDCARDRLPGEQFCTIVPLVSWSVGALSPVNH